MDCITSFRSIIFSGCSSFSTSSELDNGRTLTVLDNRLPNSLDTAFEACSGQIDIDAGETDVEIAESCDTDQLTSLKTSLRQPH